MTIPSRSARDRTPRRIGLAWPGRDPHTWATGIVVAGLLVVLAFAGCSGSYAAGSPAAGATAQSLSPSGSTAPASAFSLTGSMAVGRQAPTATLLDDGRILVAGGSGDASAELYDPATGTFSPTGSMTTARYWSTAT
jgi:hypothetical protein